MDLDGDRAFSSARELVGELLFRLVNFDMFRARTAIKRNIIDSIMVRSVQCHSLLAIFDNIRGFM